ncbi:hypothetical protein ABBQ38_014291 [Trebouxia sp. C0009 RCD-2024]
MVVVPYTVVDDAISLSTALCSLNVVSITAKPILYVDLEGINLCRHGSISILQIYQSEQDHVYLIDVHRLGASAFKTKSNDGSATLKSVLENKLLAKAFFDVRNDSDALYNQFDVYLQGVVDLQLMELRTRTRSKKLLNGLARCSRESFCQVAHDSGSSRMETGEASWTPPFAPERGGAYEVFNIRPMKQEIVDYCIQDVTFLPKLYDEYSQGMTRAWEVRLSKEASNRVAVCQQSTYIPNGRQKALAPIL